MLHYLVLLILLMSHFLPPMQAGAHFSRLNARLHAASVARAYDSEDMWQPQPSHNNWIIVQPADEESAVGIGSTNRRSHMPHSSTGSGMHQLPRPHSHTHTHPHTHPQTLTQRLPVSYFAYNHSGGNYSPPKKDVGAVEPFILAISKVRPGAEDSAETSLTRRRFSASLGSSKKDNRPNNGNSGSSGANNKGKNKWRNNNDDETPEIEEEEEYIAERNIISQPQPEVRQEIDGNLSAEDVDAEAEADVDVSDADKQQLNEMLLPVQNILDKVIHFCDVANRLLNDHEDTDENDLSTNAVAASAPSSSVFSSLPSSTPVSGEVQGRTGTSLAHTAKSSSASSSTLSLVGTGRKGKLSKKLQKLMLPLLIAYKLKFLTLVPVLIGGLTLLVGTTGLAGFFFALFAAVMSLKSGGGKSIVVKKI